MSDVTDPDDRLAELLSASLDGELTPAEQAEADAALAASSDARAELADLRAARDAVRALDGPEPPAGFVDGVGEAIGSSDRSRRSNRVLAVLAGGAAAAVVVAALVVPPTDHVDPRVATRVATHAARASVSDDPVTELAPVAAAPARPRR